MHTSRHTTGRPRVAVALGGALLATSLLGAGTAVAAAPAGHPAARTAAPAAGVRPHFSSTGTITTPFNSSVLCLEADPAALGADGDPVEVATCDGSAQQQWTLSDATTGDAAFTIVNVADGKCLEASPSEPTTAGDPIDVSSCTGGYDQQWGIGHYCTDPAVCTLPDNEGFLGNMASNMVATDPDPATDGSVPSMQYLSVFGEGYAPGYTWEVPPGPIAT
jgi:hypothetical protein